MIKDTTIKYYSQFVDTDISKLTPGIHFVESIKRDEEIRGFGCNYSVYALEKDDILLVTYSPRYRAFMDEIRNSDKEVILDAIKNLDNLKILKLFIFNKEKVSDFKKARILKREDYSNYEKFFLETNPGAEPEGWLDEYFYEKTDRQLFTGYYEGDALVSVCDAPDMPYMEGEIQHTGIMTLKEARGKGYGKCTAGLATHNLIERGICPQWECNMDNVRSANLAKSIGYEEYGVAYIIEDYT
ncbi:MAG: GNAT family N-acetyltransferase [Lachnospiraceae bacterium]|nr:GNAT family N-acetyltransferase [Lachnospiraceae bacterium]